MHVAPGAMRLAELDSSRCSWAPNTWVLGHDEDVGQPRPVRTCSLLLRSVFEGLGFDGVA